MLKPLEIEGETAFRTTDQKVWGSNPYGRALVSLQIQNKFNLFVIHKLISEYRVAKKVANTNHFFFVTPTTYPQGLWFLRCQADIVMMAHLAISVSMKTQQRLGNWIGIWQRALKRIRFEGSAMDTK